MLGEEQQIVYDAIRAIAVEEDVYKVIDADEIIDKLPEGVAMTKVQLSKIIRELKDEDRISVKYFTPDEYCLLVVKSVVTPSRVESDVSEKGVARAAYVKKQKEPAKKTSKIGGGWVFFMAFLGGALGSAIVAVIMKFVL